MSFLQLVVFAVAQQLLQAGAAVAKVGAANTTNPIGNKAYSVAGQVCTNLLTLLSWGVAAAATEFATQQAFDSTVLTNEKTIATKLPTLPPIT